MAHKHNRRRVRHRSRRNRYEQNLPTLYESNGYESLSSLSDSDLSIPATPFESLPALSPKLDLDGAILRRWLMQNSGEDRSSSHNKHSRTYLSETHMLETFGGEPGEDLSLVPQMQDMFDSMDWVNT